MASGDPENLEVSEAEPARRHWASTLAIILGIAILALLVTAWFARRPIAEHFIERELEKRGVEASYTIEKLGLRDQLLRNIVIGDPKDPDAKADYALIQMRLSWSGIVKVYRVVADGVRLKGTLQEDGKVTWGELDKLLPEPSGEPFKLPDVAVAVSDAQITLDSPYGRMGFAVSGSGNLTGGFAGKLAASGPTLAFGNCTLTAFKGLVDVKVEARKPHVIGPVRAESYACPTTRLAIDKPRIALDSYFSEGFDRFEGEGRLNAANFQAGDNGLANINATLGFDGTADDAKGSFKLAAQRARLAAIYAEGTQLDGSYRLWAKSGRLHVRTKYQAYDAALSDAVLSQFTGPLQALKDTPAGPATAAIADALRRTGKQFDASGELVLVNLKKGGGVRVLSADLVGPGGATIRLAGGEGVNYFWPSGNVRIDGDVATGGGGLPTMRLALSQPKGAALSGEARIAPYAARGSRLVLAPVRFAAQPNGATRVTTTVVTDGPISGARIAGLRLPVDGVIGGPGGGFSFGRSCMDASFAALTSGSLTLRNARLPICPGANPIVSKRGNGPVTFDANARNLRLAGNVGSSPLALTASRFRFWGQEDFLANGFAMRLGRSASPVAFDAGRLDGKLVDGGAAGKFADADVTIAAVPVALDDAGGSWRFTGSRLAIDGGAVIFDREDEDRFYPLRTDDLAFLLSGDRITTTGTLRHPDSEAVVANVDIEHRLSSGSGEALLDVTGLDFSPIGLQPDMITPLASGVIALVDGRMTGQGRIAWNGSGEVTSSGEFTTRDMDLAASFGPVTGLSTTIRFTDLLGLETAPGQRLHIGTINPGILAENGEIRYQLLPGQLVKIERGEWPFMGGRLILEETILNLGRDSPKRLTFTVVGLDAKTFVDTLQFKEIQATGIFDGVLPMIFDEDGGRIVGGRLESREGGGSLSYVGAVSDAELGFFGELAFDALKSLRFSNMVIRLDGDLAGEFATRLTIDQVALANATGTQRLVKSLVGKIPFKFNVTISGPFRALIATAKSLRDPRSVISDVMPVPLDKIPGLVTEVRRREESETQTQTPVDQQVDISATPPEEDE